MTEYHVIDDRSEFERALEQLADGTGPVAVDVERASGFRYSQRAYLIQVFRRDSGVFLFDPPAIGDFSGLQDAIGSIPWLLHAASQDLPSLHEEGLYPDSIFDTELASRLLGYDRVGLGAVIERTLGITLAKAHSADDWSTRPLPQSWLEYAALDVVYLVDAWETVRSELEEQGKIEIARQEFEAVRLKEPKPPREDPWRRLSGLHSVRGRRNLAVARSLWQAREDFARDQDVSPGRLVPDRSLVAAIMANPGSKHELGALKAFTGRASRTQLDRWWAAIEQGRAATDLPAERVSSDTLPPPRAWADRNPAADLRYKAARPAVEGVAEALHMPTENLLTPEYLRRVAWEHPGDDATSVGAALRTLGAREWQIDETSQIIADAFVESTQIDPETTETTS